MKAPKLRPNYDPAYCPAKSRTTGNQCGRKTGGKVCYSHGKGGGRPIIHGRYSKLPTRIHDAFEKAIGDPKLLDLAEGVALLDALLQERIARLAAGDDPEWRRNLWDTAELISVHMLSSDWSAAAKALRAHIDLIKTGCNSDKAEAAIFAMRERVSARVEELHRIRLARGSVVNGRDLASLQVMQFREMRRVLDLEGVSIAIQQKLVRALIAQATSADIAPLDYRAELNASAMEVAGGRA